MESWSERSRAINSPSADAIVDLSSGKVFATGIAKVSEWVEPDRFYGGIKLLKAGKCPLDFHRWMVTLGTSSDARGRNLAEYAK